MKLALLNKYSAAAILFMGVAAVLIAFSFVTTMGEFVTAAYVISAMICAMTGIFIITFSGGEPVDLRLVGLLPVQGCINICQIAADLGISGNAWFLPPRLTGKNRVMQFNPRSDYTGTAVTAKGSFPESGPDGLVTIPSCDPLIQDLRKRSKLFVPDNEQNLSHFIRETTGEIFEFAHRVSTRWTGNQVTITFHRYRFIEGCRIIAQESAGCCVRNPCPACSLCGAFIAEGTDKVVTLKQCSVSSSNQDVIMIFSVISAN